MHLHRCRGRDDYFGFVNGPELASRWRLESYLATQARTSPLHAAPREAVTFPGLCAACDRVVELSATFAGAWCAPDGTLVPNWRDALACPLCTMSGRQRMVAELLTTWAAERRGSHESEGYLMEQISPLYRWATAAFPEVHWTGSEYLEPGRVAGTDAAGLRHENAEALSLADASIDLVVSCDVLEHVNDPRAVIAEIVRVLRPGATAILTFPMDPHRERNQRRAELVEGEPRHLLPAMYHGNPLSTEGSLVFHDFGWEVLDQLRDGGLRDATLTVYWGYERGYLGIQFYFSGHKA
jgi:SAM-dependent methyltransferase